MAADHTTNDTNHLVSVMTFQTEETFPTTAGVLLDCCSPVINRMEMIARIILSSSIVFGNIFTLIAQYRFRWLHTKTTLLISSLAMADMFVSVALIYEMFLPSAIWMRRYYVVYYSCCCK